MLREFPSQLKRLQTDYIDLYQIHDCIHAAPEMLLGDTIPALLRLKEKGYIGHIGITGRFLRCMKELKEKCDEIECLLTFGNYNLMDTSMVGYFDELRREKNIGLLNCSVLFMGALTRQALTEPHGLGGDMLKWNAQFRPYLEQAIELCDRKGVNIGELAVQFGCDCPMCDSTILSVARRKRLKQNMALVGKSYDKDLAFQVHEILSSHGIYEHD